MTAPLPHYHVIHPRFPESRKRTYRFEEEARAEILSRILDALYFDIPIEGNPRSGYWIGAKGEPGRMRFHIQVCETLSCPDALEDTVGIPCTHLHAKAREMPYGLEVKSQVPSALDTIMLPVHTVVPQHALSHERRDGHFHTYRSSDNSMLGWQATLFDSIHAYLKVASWVVTASEIYEADIQGCCPDHGYIVRAVGGRGPVYMRALMCSGTHCDQFAPILEWTWEYDPGIQCPSQLVRGKPRPPAGH